MSRVIHKKWRPLKDIEARDLKFFMGPCITYTHTVQKWRLNLRTFGITWTIMDYHGISIEI